MAMPLEKLDYSAEYKEIQPSLFRESEVLDTLLQSIFNVCDKQQEDLLWVSQNLLNIDAAEKSQLDFIGNIVGQPRFLSDFNTEPYFGYDGSYQSKTFGSSADPEIGGYWNSRSYFNTATSRKLNDDEYRRLIKARVIYNQSNCTSNDLLEVINLITNSKNNTVQMLKHGLVQINSDDSTGILSYFVDRLLMMDNILPIAAGVRVGLEQIVGSGGGDTLKCTPSGNVTFSEAEYRTATYRIGGTGSYTSKFEITPQFLFTELLLANDGTSSAFVINLAVKGVTPAFNSGGAPIIEILPINSQGEVTCNGATYDIRNGYDESLSIFNDNPNYLYPTVVAEKTILEIIPTIDTVNSEDLYYILGGVSGEPLVFQSCAKAVFSEAPVVCVPTTLPIIYKEGVNEPTGELYGRYRINGGDWVDYTVLADYYLVNNFLGDTGVMDRQGGSQITPFQFQMGYGRGLIRGASAQEPYTDGQDGVMSVERTTIDFQITDGGANDLVQLLFGGDASVSSCAVGSWYGV